MRLAICDDVGHMPSIARAGVRVFPTDVLSGQLTAIVSSNKDFSVCTEIFEDAVAIAAIVTASSTTHQVLVLNGESYGLSDEQRRWWGQERVADRPVSVGRYLAAGRQGCNFRKEQELTCSSSKRRVRRTPKVNCPEHLPLLEVSAKY